MLVLYNSAAFPIFMDSSLQLKNRQCSPTVDWFVLLLGQHFINVQSTKSQWSPNVQAAWNVQFLNNSLLSLNVVPGPNEPPL